MRLALCTALVCLTMSVSAADDPRRPESLFARHFLVTWYGNPATARMGVLGAAAGEARASALRRQADAYRPLTGKTVLGAYHLVAVVAQPRPGRDGAWRLRAAHDEIRALLDEARAHGFLLFLDIQPGRSTVLAEIDYLREFLGEPDVHLALDPEFTMDDGCVPGQRVGHMHAAAVNDAIAALGKIVAARQLPAKVLVVHQFTLAMLPDKPAIRDSDAVDLVLNMDGFGSQSLKLASYRTILRQRPLEHPGIKLFYRQDTNLFTPRQVMALEPRPALVIYQ